MENIVLNRGLGFVPTTRGPNITKHNDQLNRFERTLQNFFFFSKHQSNNNTSYNKQPFTGISQWQPTITNPNISKFVRNLNINLLDTRRSKLHYNISKGEKKALQDLKHNNSIVIKRADKGGCLVIMDRSDYISKAENLLNDKCTYEEVNKDATHDIHMVSNDVILSLLLNKHIINHKQYKYLTDYVARCPVFYGLPKIHKANWPLRPIVSQINGPVAKLNEIVDTYLKPCVAYIPELLQDTTMFLNRLESLRDSPNMHPELYLITIDVTSLYTNIPHEEGAKWVSEFYEETYPLWKDRHTNLAYLSKGTMYTLIMFILQNNVFGFNHKFYKQLTGTTMGARFSVNYANIYMHKFFKQFNQQCNFILPPGFGRFVDDIFHCWYRDLLSLKDYLDKLNGFHDSIKFEVEISSSSVHFLDTLVYIEDGVLKTKLYVKQTDKKQYLAYNSEHPNHIKKAIPYSQGLRLKRIVSDNSILDQTLEILQDKFIQRGYPKSFIREELAKLKDAHRTDLLQYRSASSKIQRNASFLKGKPFLPLIITFFQQYESNRHTNVREIVTKHWRDFISSDEEIRKVFHCTFPQIIFTRGNTISNSLIRANLPKTTLTTTD